MRLLAIFLGTVLIQISISAPNGNDETKKKLALENMSSFDANFKFQRGTQNIASNHGLASRAESNKDRRGAQSRSTQLSTNLLNPIRTFVNQASSAARNAFSGMRDRITNTMTSITDYIVNGIPYAQEASKVPNEHIPEYAKGEPVPKFDHPEMSDRTFASSNSLKRKNPKLKTPEDVYQDFVDRLEGKSYYKTYYSLRDADLQYIKDYEQLLENQKSEKEYGEDAINILLALYRKLEELVRQNNNKSKAS